MIWTKSGAEDVVEVEQPVVLHFCPEFIRLALFL